MIVPVRRVVGRRVFALDPAELAALFERHARAVVDVGTGNGRPILLRAAAEPTTLAVGLDADAAAMAEASRRAARSPARGGLPNALFLVAGAESLPEALKGRFGEALVLFPWGSLLRGVMAGQQDSGSGASDLVGELAGLLRAGGRLTVMLSLTEHDAGLGGVPPSLSRDALEPLTRAAAAAGLAVVEAREASRDEVLATGSSWAKRIRAGTPARPAWIVHAIMPGRGSATSAVAELLPPGSTIGILGGGQLGRLMAIAARRFGYRCVALDPDPEAPAGGVVERLIVAPYADRAAAFELAARSDVVTYELEHVDADVVASLATEHAVRPGLTALRVTQDRLAERRFLEGEAAGLADWREVRSLDDLRSGVASLGLPCRLKAAFGGYDGRSQARLTSLADLPGAFETLGAGVRPLLLEREIDFAAELSVVCARGLDGVTRPFPVARNRHDEGILIESVVPARIPASAAQAAQALAARLAEALGLIGLLTVELFLLPDGGLLVNELAPRVHNSGHWTLDACATSQFEQHVRAICGLPLGSVEMTAPAAAMVNLLGSGPARPARLEGLGLALADPAVRVTLYDKRRVFERRKMGHLTAIGAEPEEALERARAAARLLRWSD